MNRLAISDIISINIDEYKAYLEESSEKNGKVGKLTKKIHIYLEWYLHKNISDILSNQMFHECFYVLERIQFSPDVTKLAYSTFDHCIRIDNLNSEGKFEQNDLIFKYHTKKIIKIEFSNDGTKLVTLGMDKNLIFWDIKEQTFLSKIKPENANFRCVRFSNSDKLFAAGTDDSLLMVWTLNFDDRKNTLLHLFQDHKKAVTALDFSSDDNYLCSGSEDKTILMHQVKSGELLHCFQEHYDTITSLRFSPISNTFVSGGQDRKVILWNADEKCKIKDFKSCPEEITHIFYSPEGTQIFSVDKDCKIYVFDETGELKLGPLKEHEKKIESIGFMLGADNRYMLVTASRDRYIVRWNTLTGKIINKPLSRYPMKTNNSQSIISPDCQKIITVMSPPPLYINTIMTKWKAGSGISEDRMEYENIIFTKCTFSTNSESFAAATKDHRIYLWKISNIKAPIHIIDHIEELDITYLAYHIDKASEILAAGSNNKKLNFWDAAKNNKICDEKEGHEGPISIIKFSADGTRMATYSFDFLNTIAIWNPTQGQRLFGLTDHGKIELTSIRFSQDGMKMACGNKQGIVYIYNASNTTTSKWKLYNNLLLDQMHGPLTALAFSKHDFKIATACKKGTGNEINVWDYSTGNLQIGPLVGHHFEINLLSFSRDDSVLTSFSKDSLKSWRFFNKSSLKTHLVDGNDIYDVSIDGSKILGRGKDKSDICVYSSIDFHKEFVKMENPSKDLTFLSFSSDGMFCLGGDKNSLTIWSAKTGEIKKKIKNSSKYFMCGIFSENDEMLVTGSFSGSITIWNLNKGVENFTFNEKHKGEVILLSFAPNDNFVASADIKNKIYVWNIEKQIKIYEMAEHEDKLISLEISYDSKSVCSISEDRNIKLWSFLGSDNKMRDLEKSITKNKKLAFLKFTYDWNMYCIIMENRKKIEFYDAREKVPIKALEFQNPIINVFWSKNNDVFLVFQQEVKCYMHFLNGELLFLEKGLEICEFYKDPEKFSSSEIQKIIDGNLGKVMPFSYTLLQVIAYSNDYKGFFSKLLLLMKQHKIQISTHAFFDKDIHGNSCMDIILMKKEKIIIKMIFKYIIKHYTVRDLFKEDYNINMTLLYTLLEIFGQDTYIIDKLLKMSYDAPERFPENFNYQELPVPLYMVRPQPQLTKTEVKPKLSEHLLKFKNKGHNKFKTKIQVKCVYIPDILDENTPDTLTFFKNICKLSSTNKLFENSVLAKVISYKWDTEGSKDFFRDSLVNLAFLLIYLFNALFMFPFRWDPSYEYYSIFCYISIFCDVVLYSFLFYQGSQEAQQCYILSVKHYISSIWNVVDVIKILCGIISTSVDLLAIIISSAYTYSKGFHAITIFVSFIKMVSFARGVKNSAFIVRLVIQVFLDIQSFLSIVFVFIICLGFSVFMIQTDFAFNPFESFNIFFRNMLGDFTDFDNLSVIDSRLLYLFFMVGSLLVTIILLNLLIAIICDTYKKVSKNEKTTRIYEMCSILYETDTREVQKSDNNEAQYLFCVSNHSDHSKKDKDQMYGRIKKKLKQNNFVFMDKMAALEQRLEMVGGLKDKKSASYLFED